jgi:DNA invertase Pin-like site-specific DNA recombinase
MALIGYARCSTTHQDTTAQIDALVAAGVPQGKLFSEHISGAAPFAERIQLQAAITACQPGDQLLVAKLDRLGRSMQDCVSRAADLLEAGIHIRTLDGRVDTLALGKMAKLVIGILAAAAEIERDLILERTEEGRQRALAQGVKFGRKRGWKPEQAAHVRELVAQGLSHRQVAARVGLSASTIRRMLKEPHC